MSEKLWKIGFIGGGKIAQAMAKGFISAKLAKGETITSSCHPSDIASANAFKDLGASNFFENTPVVERSEVVIISTKPSIVPIALADIKNVPNITEKLFISIAMGVTFDILEKLLPRESRVVRVMPNTPALVKAAASVFACGSSCTKKDAHITKTLFQSIGTIEEIPESMFDVATAVNGAGPAYILILIEALADGAVKMGVPRDMAYRLVSQTVYGAAKLARDTKIHPGELKDNVASPAGATIAGCHYLEEKGVRSAFIGAIETATKRAMEVRQQSK